MKDNCAVTKAGTVHVIFSRWSKLTKPVTGNEQSSTQTLSRTMDSIFSRREMRHKGERKMSEKKTDTLWRQHSAAHTHPLLERKANVGKRVLTCLDSLSSKCSLARQLYIIDTYIVC